MKVDRIGMDETRANETKQRWDRIEGDANGHDSKWIRQRKRG